MKFIPLLLTSALAAPFALAAPADDVAAAVKKIADAPNYSWTVTTEFANAQFPALPAEGATEKGGYTVVKVTFGDNTFTTVRKGEQAVSQGRDGIWLTMEERRAQFAGGGTPQPGGPGSGGGGVGRGGRGGMGFFGGSATQSDLARDVTNLAAKLQDAKLVDGAITGTLPAEEAARLLSFPRGGRGGGQAPAPKNASASVRFWIKDGTLAKYAVNAKGTVTTPNGDERDIDLTTTTEFKNVGTAKIVVPEEAKKKLGE